MYNDLDERINIVNVSYKDYINDFQITSIKKAVDYLQTRGEKVIHFPLKKRFNYSLEEVESLLVAFKLEKNKDLLEIISRSFDLKFHQWDLDEISKGDVIRSGSLRILNYLLTCYCASKESIIIIDKYEDGLHPMLLKPLLRSIISIAQPKYLFAFHYTDELGYNYGKNVNTINRFNSFIKEI